jgi:hypothetical protein
MPGAKDQLFPSRTLLGIALQRVQRSNCLSSGLAALGLGFLVAPISEVAELRRTAWWSGTLIF